MGGHLGGSEFLASVSEAAVTVCVWRVYSLVSLSSTPPRGSLGGGVQAWGAPEEPPTSTVSAPALSRTGTSGAGAGPAGRPAARVSGPSPRGRSALIFTCQLHVLSCEVAVHAFSQ